MGSRQCWGSWAGTPWPIPAEAHIFLPSFNTEVPSRTSLLCPVPRSPRITCWVIQPWLPKSAAICHTRVFSSPPAPPFPAQVSPACVVEVQASPRSNSDGSRPLGMRFFFFFSNPLEKQMLWLIFIIPTLIYFNCSGYPEYYDCIISCICL